MMAAPGKYVIAATRPASLPPPLGVQPPSSHPPPSTQSCLSHSVRLQRLCASVRSYYASTDVCRCDRSRLARRHQRAVRRALYVAGLSAPTTRPTSAPPLWADDASPLDRVTTAARLRRRHATTSTDTRTKTSTRILLEGRTTLAVPAPLVAAAVPRRRVSRFGQLSVGGASTLFVRV